MTDVTVRPGQIRHDRRAIHRGVGAGLATGHRTISLGATVLIIWAFGVLPHHRQGVFHCQRCGGDRQYRHRSGRRFFTVFFIRSSR